MLGIKYAFSSILSITFNLLFQWLSRAICLRNKVIYVTILETIGGFVSNYILDRKWVSHHIARIVFYYLNSNENDEYYGSFSSINIDYVVQYKACFYIQKKMAI